MSTMNSSPYGSVLVTAPTFSFAQSRRPGRHTWLFSFLNILCVFTSFGSAEEFKVFNRVPFHELLNEDTTKNATTSPSSTEASDSGSDTQTTPKFDLRDHIAEPFAKNSNEPWIEDIINGISHDLFHHPTEANFYESRWQDELDKWANSEATFKGLSEFEKTNSSNTMFAFFAQDQLNWDGMECNHDIHGCTKMPSPEFIRRQFPNDPHRARQLTYIIDSFRRMNVETEIYTKAFAIAKKTLGDNCYRFAETFFHQATQGKKEMCPAEIVQIVMAVIAAIVTIITIGQAAYALAPLVSTSLAVITGGAAAEAMVAQSVAQAVTDVWLALHTVEIVSEVASEFSLGSSLSLSTASSLSAGSSTMSLIMESNEAFMAGYQLTSISWASSSSAAGSAGGAIGSSANIDLATIFANAQLTGDHVLDLNNLLYQTRQLPDVSRWVSETVDLHRAGDMLKFRFKGVDLLQPMEDVVAYFHRPVVSVKRRDSETPTNQLPPSFDYNFNSTQLENLSKTAAFVAKYMLGDVDYNTIGLARSLIVREVMKVAPGAQGSGHNVPDETFTRDMGDYLVKSITHTVWATHANVTGRSDVDAYIRERKAEIAQNRRALGSMVQSTLSSFMTSAHDNTPLPKEWGSLNVMEWFPVSELTHESNGNLSPYDQFDVRSRMVFQDHLNRTKNNSTGEIDWQKLVGLSSNMTRSDLEDNNVLRLTKLATIYEKPATHVPQIDSVNSLGSRIALRMQDRDGNALSFNQTMALLKDVSFEIDQRLHLLRTKDPNAPPYVPIKYPKTAPQIGVATSMDTLAWSSLLGSVKFEGVSTEGADDPQVPEMRWSAQPSNHAMNRLGKRAAKNIMGSVLSHELMGSANKLRSMGLINQGENKHVKRDEGLPFDASKILGTLPHRCNKKKIMWTKGDLKDDEDRGRNPDEVEVEERETEQGDMFVVKVKDHMFKNDIHREICGKDSYTGYTEDNERSCHKFLDTMDKINDRLSFTASVLETCPQDFSDNLKRRFSTFSSFQSADMISLQKDTLTEKILSNAKNSLVSKAYADQNCYLKCRPDSDGRFSGFSSNSHAECISGCFDQIEGAFPELYGFESARGLPATKHIWKMDKEQIENVSWTAYQNRDPTGFLPGRIDLNPYTDNIKDHSPILPTCYSEYENEADFGSKGVLCNCGDKWGNETEYVLAISNWAGGSKKEERMHLKTCLDRQRKLAETDPGAFLINSCRTYFQQLVPPGSGSYLEKKNKGHYKENNAACDIYLKFYNENKHLSDAQLNDRICWLWKENHKGRHKQGGHIDFTYVNDLIDNTQCGHRW